MPGGPPLVLIAAGAIAATALLWYLFANEEKDSNATEEYNDRSNYGRVFSNYPDDDERTRFGTRRRPTYSYGETSNPYNNHDHQKVPHATREEAEAAAQSMLKRKGVHLNTYYNPELDAWFNGRSKNGY